MTSWGGPSPAPRTPYDGPRRGSENDAVDMSPSNPLADVFRKRDQMKLQQQGGPGMPLPQRSMMPMGGRPMGRWPAMPPQQPMPFDAIAEEQRKRQAMFDMLNSRQGLNAESN